MNHNTTMKTKNTLTIASFALTVLVAGCSSPKPAPRPATARVAQPSPTRSVATTPPQPVVPQSTTSATPPQSTYPPPTTDESATIARLQARREAELSAVGQPSSTPPAATTPTASSPPQSSQSPYRPPTVAIPRNTASYTIDIAVQFNSTITRGENRLMVELRQGVPGSSRVFDTKYFEGQTATVSFSQMPPGSYFVAIGNGDSVAVGPVRQFSDGQRVNTRMRVTYSSGNVGTRSRSGL
jgi:hypothetical protein